MIYLIDATTLYIHQWTDEVSALIILSPLNLAISQGPSQKPHMSLLGHTLHLGHGTHEYTGPSTWNAFLLMCSVLSDQFM